MEVALALGGGATVPALAAAAVAAAEARSASSVATWRCARCRVVLLAQSGVYVLFRAIIQYCII